MAYLLAFFSKFFLLRKHTTLIKKQPFAEKMSSSLTLILILVDWNQDDFKFLIKLNVWTPPVRFSFAFWSKNENQKLTSF